MQLDQWAFDDDHGPGIQDTCHGSNTECNARSWNRAVPFSDDLDESEMLSYISNGT